MARVISLLLLFYFLSEINLIVSHREIKWDHIDMSPVPNIAHTPGPAGGPIKYVQIGHGGRVEYMYAVVEKKHLNTGTKTNKDSTKYVRDLGHDKGDDAGHVLASRLGGSGTDHHNLFPQNPSCNSGAWRAFVEDVVYKEVNKNGNTEYKVKLNYKTPTDTRPYEIWGQVKLHQGTNNYYTNELANPPSNQKCGD